MLSLFKVVRSVPRHWFNLTRAFALLNLQPGDTVQFDARVKAYLKWYFGRREEVYKPTEVGYTLSYPTLVKKVVP